uniref:peptidylprolyl isomerase n=1 Tax=Physcomitrium patens TaxID=3218 RepID=A0A7I4FPX0_PHYPA
MLSLTRASHLCTGAAIWTFPAAKMVSTPRQASLVRCSMSKKGEKMQAEMPRREALATIALGTALSWLPSGIADAAGLPPGPPAPKICDDTCEKELDSIPMETTPSGLQYKDIVVGTGDSPPVGFQVAANYVAMIPNGKIFDSSLEKGVPYIFRVGAGQVVKGLDEGILTMKVGGKRRLYIPGELAFPKGLGAAAGRPRVPPSSPVIFDVSLLYIPGISDFEE